MKTNRFLLVAIFGFALTFTFSCSSDDDGGTVACKAAAASDAPDGSYSFEMCYEFSGENAAKYKEKNGCEVGSCPSGYELECDDQKFKGATVYIYSNLFKDCDAWKARNND